MEPHHGTIDIVERSMLRNERNDGLNERMNECAKAVHMSVYDGVKETAPSVKDIPPLLSGFFEREISAR